MLELPTIPHSKLLMLSWEEISSNISKRSTKQFVSDVKTLAIALGEINRFHSNKLPDNHLFDLWKKQTKLRRLVKTVNFERSKQNKKEIIPLAMLDYWAGGSDNEKYRRQANG